MVYSRECNNIMLVVKSEIPLLKRKIKNAQNRLRREKPRLMKIIANKLKRLAIGAFTKLSRGGSAIGITWPALSPGYLAWKRKRGYSTRIGIRTGLLRRSNFIEITGGRQVSIEYEVREKSLEGDTGYHTAFSERRSLLPVNVPQEWLDELVPEIEEWANDILQEELGDFA